MDTTEEKVVTPPPDTKEIDSKLAALKTDGYKIKIRHLRWANAFELVLDDLPFFMQLLKPVSMFELRKRGLTPHPTGGRTVVSCFDSEGNFVACGEAVSLIDNYNKKTGRAYAGERLLAQLQERA